MRRTITVELHEPGHPRSTATVEATAFGDWAVHGVFEFGSFTPSADAFTVTHIPTGMTINSVCGRLTREHAEQLAELLSIVAPGGEHAVRARKQIVHDAVAYIEVLRWGDCENYHERIYGEHAQWSSRYRERQPVTPGAAMTRPDQDAGSL